MFFLRLSLFRNSTVAFSLLLFPQVTLCCVVRLLAGQNCLTRTFSRDIKHC